MDKEKRRNVSWCACLYLMNKKKLRIYSAREPTTYSILPSVLFSLKNRLQNSVIEKLLL